MSPGGLANIERPLSPNAGFCMRDNDFRGQVRQGGNPNDQLSPRSDNGSA
jgi:hypothetical protein